MYCRCRNELLQHKLMVHYHLCNFSNFSQKWKKHKCLSLGIRWIHCTNKTEITKKWHWRWIYSMKTVFYFQSSTCAFAWCHLKGCTHNARSALQLVATYGTIHKALLACGGPAISVLTYAGTICHSSATEFAQKKKKEDNAQGLPCSLNCKIHASPAYVTIKHPIC